MKTTPLYVIRKGADAEAEWLRAHGFSGVCSPENECGCYIDDLYPCGERGDKHACIAGYATDSGVYRFDYSPKRPPAVDAVARSGEKVAGGPRAQKPSRPSSSSQEPTP